MGVYAGGWVLIAAFVLLVLIATNIPREMMQPPAAPGGARTDVAATTDPNTAASPDAPGPQAASAETAPKPSETQQAAQRAAANWFRRSWPAIVLCVLVGMVASLWLNGGQIGYLGDRVRGGSAGLLAFHQAGIRSMGRLLRAWCLGSLVGFVPMIAVALLVAVLTKPGAAAAADTALAAVLFLVVVPALIWLLVRLAFWFIAIVVDGLSALGGLKASFRVTQGRWWRTCGLVAVFTLIAVALEIVFSLIAALGGVMGAGVAGVAAFVTGILRVAVINLYLGFVGTAALIRFYEDAGSPADTVSSPAS